MTLIRPEATGDAAAIRVIHAAAFGGTGEADLVDDLRRNQHLTVSLVAEEDGVLTGHVALSPIVLDASPDLFALGLAPLAVRPESQRQGIGSRLTEAALEAADRMGIAFVVVLGEPAFYGRFGFTRADSLGIGNEYGAGEHFMIRLPDGDPGAGHEFGPGIVRYGPEFGRFGD
jgi:putative acetyltransferase